MRIKKIAHIGVGGQKGFVYDSSGSSPTLPATQYKDPTKFIEVKEDGNTD